MRVRREADSRGLLDGTALLAQLERGGLRGRVLCVVERESPPPDHPFRNHPRVVVTPHVSDVSERFRERTTKLVVENARRYRAGRRLENLVNVEVGY